MISHFLPLSLSLIAFAERDEKVGEITPINVAQSKTLVNREDKFGAANAVDKDLSTQAGAAESGASTWLKLEFDKTYFIHTIIYYYKFYTDWFNPTAGCASSVEKFKSCVDIDTDIAVSVYQGEVLQRSCGTLQLTYGLKQSDQIYTLVCIAEGDTVKLSKSFGNIAAYEVVVTKIGETYQSYSHKNND